VLAAHGGAHDANSRNLQLLAGDDYLGGLAYAWLVGEESPGARDKEVGAVKLELFGD
jgi:hypothetical protein